MEKERTFLASRWLLLAALLTGNVALAIAPYFVRIADSGVVAAGFWRLFLALPFLFALAHFSGEKPFAIPRSALWVVLFAGFIFAFDLASWHVGIELTRVGNATVFGNSGSLILMVWGFLVWRRMPSNGEWLAIICALVGVAILLGRSLEISTDTLIGDLFCILAGLFYAAYLIILQRARANLGSWSLLAWSGMAGAPVMLVIALLRGEPVLPTDWTPLVALMISSQLIGQGLLVYALRHFPPLIIGLALLTQPVTGSLIGWIAFREALSGLDIAGMVLIALALVIARSQQKEAPSTEAVKAASTAKTHRG